RNRGARGAPRRLRGGALPRARPWPAKASRGGDRGRARARSRAHLEEAAHGLVEARALVLGLPQEGLERVAPRERAIEERIATGLDRAHRVQIELVGERREEGAEARGRLAVGLGHELGEEAREARGHVDGG